MERIFNCVLCSKKFSMVDVEALNFFFPSQVCRGCYEAKPVPCFGTYDLTAEECTQFCPDRLVCFEWPELVQIAPSAGQAVFRVAMENKAEEKLRKAKQKTRARDEAAPFQQGSIIGAFFRRAASAEGLLLDHLKAVCAEIDANPKDYYRRLYGGYNAGWKWDARLGDNEARDSVLFITNVQRAIAKKGKR